MSASLPELVERLEVQWNLVYNWVKPFGNDVLGHKDQPSALPGWSIGELIAHLGRAISALAGAQAAPNGTIAWSLAEYLGTYPERASEISVSTVELANQIAADPLAEIQAMAQASITNLKSLVQNGVSVVQARRGYVTLRDMAVSRLIELVVHAQDLLDSLRPYLDLHTTGNPIDPRSQEIVAQELLAIVTARGGWDLQISDPNLWIRLATGRQKYNSTDLSRALYIDDAAGGVPDLGRAIPVL